MIPISSDRPAVPLDSLPPSLLTLVMLLARPLPSWVFPAMPSPPVHRFSDLYPLLPARDLVSLMRTS